MWNLIGGFDGLKKMRENAEWMIILAAYAQQWNFDEGVVVAERIIPAALLRPWRNTSR